MNSFRRLCVVLTGGIASGKSAVARRFEKHGVRVHDADVAAREVVQPGCEGLQAVVEAFGEDVLDADGQLDRPAMRQRIFADPGARKTLESIMHPRIRQWLQTQAHADTGPYCLLAIPLLAENAGHYRWADRVVVVDVPETTQMARLVGRDGIDETLAQRILAAQSTRTARLALADDVIDNSGLEALLDDQVAALHQRYLNLAASRR